MLDTNTASDLQPCPAAALLRQCHHTTTPTASIMAKITTTISAEFSIQAMAGTASAMARPSAQTCQENTCRPAVKVPSANSVNTAIAVEFAVKFRCTLGSSSMFITTMKASQCSTCEPINISRAVLSLALGHRDPTQTSASSGANNSQKPTIGCLEKLV